MYRCTHCREFVERSALLWFVSARQLAAMHLRRPVAVVAFDDGGVREVRQEEILCCPLVPVVMVPGLAPSALS